MILYVCVLVFSFPEDAKRMAIKEEQHDPGYEESTSSATQQCSFYPANEQGDHLCLFTAFIHPEAGRQNISCITACFSGVRFLLPRLMRNLKLMETQELKKQNCFYIRIMCFVFFRRFDKAVLGKIEKHAFHILVT